MEFSQGDEEKYTAIRQTIRRVILPLVQVIYDEDPSDMILFCSQYFNDQLQKRERIENVIEDGNRNCTEAFGYEKEADKCAGETNESRQSDNILSTNIQFSASAPLLTSEKQCSGLSLKEASSWNVPSSNSKSDGPPVVLTDAMCRIGDQPSPILKHEEDPETVSKAGDVDFALKIEEKIFEGDNLTETSTMIANDSRVKAVQEKHVLPSAPPYEDYGQNLREVKTGIESSEVCTQDLATPQQKHNLILEDRTINEISGTIPSVPSCSYSEEYSAAEEGKICNKPISPNSSFGFIPHLKEYDPEEETRKETARFSGSLGKTMGKIQELTENVSETFQNLAQNFNSAETNLNDEFQKAKEISDIIQGRCQTKATDEDAELVLDLNKGNASIVEENIKGNTSVPQDNFDVVTVKNDNNGVKDAHESTCEFECVEFTDKTPDKSCNAEETSCDRNAYNSLKEREISYGTAENISHHEKAKERSPNEQDSELYEGVKKCNFMRNNKKEDESRTDSFDSRPVVDESWRKRWYEAHPCLDNTNSNFYQTAPRFFRTQRLYFGDRRNPTTHNIGEGGDVPPETYFIPEDNSAQSLESSQPSNRMMNDDNSSPGMDECNYQGSRSADEIRRKENVTRVNRNISDWELTSSRTSGIPSQNVPYTWRKMSKQQANYLETEKQALKQLLISIGEGNSKSTPARHSKENIQASSVPETLSEIVVVKESAASIHSDVANSHCMSPHNMKQVDCEKQFHLENFKDNIKETADSTTLESVGTCEANINEEKILSVSESNDKNLEKKKACIAGYKDFTEMRQESFQKYEKKANFDNNDHSKEYMQKGFTIDRSTNDSDKISAHCKKTSEDRNSEAVKGKIADTQDSLPKIKGYPSSCQRSCDSVKLEPGINSACGDFTSSDINGNNDDDLNSEPDSQNVDENGPINSHYTENLPEVGVQTITAEYVEEIMERVTQQLSGDSYDGLNFSSCSGSETSYIESDFSETDDRM